MKSTIEKSGILILLGFITVFVFGMSGINLDQSANPDVLITVWKLSGFLLGVSFLLTARATFKDVDIRNIAWYKKSIYLPWSLIIVFVSLVIVNSVMESLAPALS